MKSLVTNKTLKKWAAYCSEHFPHAMKHLAITLNQNRNEENILVYIFNNLDNLVCQRLVLKFFVYQNVLDLKDSDFTRCLLKEKFENIFPCAEEKYSKMETSVQTINRSVHAKITSTEESSSEVKTFPLKQRIQRTIIKEGTLRVIEEDREQEQRLAS